MSLYLVLSWRVVELKAEHRTMVLQATDGRGVASHRTVVVLQITGRSRRPLVEPDETGTLAAEHLTSHVEGVAPECNRVKWHIEVIQHAQSAPLRSAPPACPPYAALPPGFKTALLYRTKQGRKGLLKSMLRAVPSCHARAFHRGGVFLLLAAWVACAVERACAAHLLRRLGLLAGRRGGRLLGLGRTVLRRSGRLARRLGFGRGPESLSSCQHTLLQHTPICRVGHTRLSRRSCMMRVESL